MKNPPALPKVQKVSGLMRQLLNEAARTENLSFGHILTVFGVRGFAFLLLVLSLLNIVIFMVPFCSIVFGLLMVILAVQIVIGLPAPIFPEVVRRQTMQRAILVRGLEQATLSLSKLERFIKPRLTFLSWPFLNRVHGLAALILAIMITPPIPFFNILPSIGLALLAIGILQRDGLYIIAGYAMGAWCLVLFRSVEHMISKWL